MNTILSDGTVSWIGGMDTSRSPADISDIQYSKAANVIIPNSLGGIRSRFGFHCAHLKFENNITEQIYKSNSVQGEGYFNTPSGACLVCVVGGYVLKFTKIAGNSFYVENANANDRNVSYLSHAWVIAIPGGCIINNGFDYPIILSESGARRSSPEKGEIGIGQMGVYLQNRLFVVDQSGRRILASDFLKPTMFTREDTNIFGFMCPDNDETITAIGKQKSIIGTVEGGNLIWSSSRDIYSVDVRGSRSDWANLGSRVGKTTETVPGFSASSSYSFESFNTNIYFRSAQYGMADLKQSEQQFVGLDSLSGQSIEASYYLDNDTDWMLDKCYTRACNKRLFTTVAPEGSPDGSVYWNGILSLHPAATYSNQGTTPRRFESVFTGIRPWCLTVIPSESSKDVMYIHSYDKDGINRLYLMNEESDFDIDHHGNTVEINGFIETRAFTMKNPLLLKAQDKRFYRLNNIDRTVKIKLFSRPDSQGQWTETWNANHLVCRTRIENGALVPEAHKGQTRAFVNVSSDKQWPCYPLGTKFLALQYRVEFSGPINLEAFVVTGSLTAHDTTISREETQCTTVVYEFLPDYGYSITK